MLEEVMRTVYIGHIAGDDIVNSNIRREKPVGAAKEFEIVVTLERHLPVKYKIGLHDTGYS
jgi:hypothetical protein